VKLFYLFFISQQGQVPDLIGVFADGPIAREVAHAGSVEDGHACPGVGIAIGDIDAVLAGEVVGKVGQDHIGIAFVEEGADDGLKEVGVLRREVAFGYLVNDAFEFGIGFIDVIGVVTF